MSSPSISSMVMLASLTVVTASLAIANAPPESASQDPAPVIHVQKDATEISEGFQQVKEEMSFFDPRLDGFDTELLNSAGGNVLKKLTALICPPADPDHTFEDVEPYLALDVDCQDLRPDESKITFESGNERIVTGIVSDKRYKGLDEFQEAMADLGSVFNGDDFHIKFKIVGIKVHSPREATTQVLYLAMGEGDEGYIQQNGRWNVHWNVEDGMDQPVLTGIDLEQADEAVFRTPTYTEVTASIFEDPAVFQSLAKGINARWGKIDTGMGFSFYGDYTIAVGDVDGDNLDDLYVCRPGGVPNLLLRHNPDGTVTNIAAKAGVDFLNDTPTALFADFDNDGHQDLIVGSPLLIVVMKGDGKGRFVPVTDLTIDNPLSFSVADINNDGLLDVYICRYSQSSRASGSGEVVFDSNDGKPNVMLRNDGNLKFTDVTKEVGLDDNNTRFSFSSVWEDYDNDGDLDVYVANDFGRNNLYQNTNGHFRDVAAQANAEDMAAGMGATWGDYDLDGDVDLYVSNMFSSAGGRIVDKEAIAKQAGEENISGLARFAKGNTLLKNNGDGTFDDVSFGAGITMGRWSWGGEFGDINNDGALDLIVPNGFVSNELSDDL